MLAPTESARDVYCVSNQPSCYELWGWEAYNVEEAIYSLSGYGYLEADNYDGVYCSDIQNVMWDNWDNDIISKYGPNDGYNAWGTQGSNGNTSYGVSFMEDYIGGASLTSLQETIIHEARHNLGQNHDYGDDYTPDDDDQAKGLCAGSIDYEISGFGASTDGQLHWQSQTLEG